MRILSADFLKSAASPKDWPDLTEPEIAFCGRSNVGKSTLINHIVGRKAIARVSNTPGRTQLLNFFSIRGDLHSNATAEEVRFTLVDLPGFGYAKVAKQERESWRPHIEAYFTKRPQLVGVFLLFDARRVLHLSDEPKGLQEEIDLFFYLLNQQIKVIPLITKSDQVPKHQQKPLSDQLQRILGKKPIMFSSLNAQGIDTIQQSIERTIVPTAPDEK